MFDESTYLIGLGPKHLLLWANPKTWDHLPSLEATPDASAECLITPGHVKRPHCLNPEAPKDEHVFEKVDYMWEQEYFEDEANDDTVDFSDVKKDVDVWLPWEVEFAG
jgi:hypothetical protein